jgi:hypothetical protein
LELAAIVAVATLALMTLFQAALALGAPLGRAAWGGRNPGVLPTRLRVASAVAAIVVYPLAILYVLDSSGLIVLGLPGAGAPAMWVLAGFFTVGVVVNLTSPSVPERVWGPVSGVIAVCCAVIALSV